MSDLIQSAVPQPQSLPTKVSAALKHHPPASTTWTETAELPVYVASLVNLQGQLLAVGGCDRYGDSSGVYTAI